MSDEWIPVTFASCEHVRGPFYHGTRAELTVGDLLTTGRPTHFQSGRTLKHLYFAALLEPAIWGAELATALSGSGGRGRIYIVEPTGPFEDDPNLTNTRFAGNPTRSYRTLDPLRIVDEVDDWEGHPAEVIEAMLSSLERLRREGRYVILD
jgi:rifampin ADP-ribosylating transferase